ncbi:hypothetical protein [Nocardia terpenica]|uniref:Uncharacterized protein n=1 Tax=Nocardia terpenica TaxID=455432 RepID=A0A164JVF9_9NOCA|nr:hypothetical protein [Nocardia terpenica]KZM70760.1 hypothetical protein AWN90_40075 [Nocardia terpenica]NQE89975.1 hypothetical protein [Nocardia terpenica]
MVFALGTHTLVLHRRIPVVDATGRPVLDAYGREQVTDIAVTVAGCDFEVTASLETESAVTITRLDGRGMLPPGTPVDYLSAVTWQGIKFEVHGPPRPVPAIRTGAIDHIAVTARSSLDSTNPASREEG